MAKIEYALLAGPVCDDLSVRLNAVAEQGFFVHSVTPYGPSRIDGEPKFLFTMQRTVADDPKIVERRPLGYKEPMISK